MGSQDHKTFFDSLLTALISPGRCLLIFSKPNLAISVIRPFSFSGFNLSNNLINVFGSKDGPHLIPIGFLIPLQNST